MKKLVTAIAIAILVSILIVGGTEAEGTYTVKQGDCLWDIAERYGISVESLISLNGIDDPRLIIPGQTLTLGPQSRGERKIYSKVTWYGADFHGSRMADGGTYDMHDSMTCASNWWPLGTWLLVKYEDEVIVVQVRDRGAFKHALDLSYEAFKRLASPSTGVIPVEIIVLGSK